MPSTRSSKVSNSLLPFLGLVALSACGGGDNFIDDLNSFNSSFGNQFFSEEEVVVTRFDDLPTSDISYSGFIFLDQFTEEVVARSVITADFDENTLSMRTSDYNVFDTEQIFVRTTSGNLAINDGIIFADEFGDAGIMGTVVGTADGTGYNTPVLGGFIGPNAEGLVAADVDAILPVVITGIAQ